MMFSKSLNHETNHKTGTMPHTNTRKFRSIALCLITPLTVS